MSDDPKYNGWLKSLDKFLLALGPYGTGHGDYPETDFHLLYMGNIHPAQAARKAIQVGVEVLR